MNYPTIHDIEDVKGKHVMVRLGLNVPIEDGKVADPYRIQEVMPTVDFLQQRGAKVIIISHIGREKDETLEPVAEYVTANAKWPLMFMKDIFSDETRHAVNDMTPGDVILFENLRQWDGETKNDPKFAELLASYADIYVNDAFPVAHRKHASVVGIPSHIPGYIGLQMIDEVENLSKAFHAEHPFIFMLGGAKVNTKLPLMKQFVGKADTIFAGGILANDFFKAEHLGIGDSLTSDVDAPEDMIGTPGFMLPKDVVVERNGDGATTIPEEIEEHDKIFDIGPMTIKLLEEKIKDAKFIIWNGPFGWTEGGYDTGTLAIAQAISKSDAYSVIGGGDTLSAVPNEVEEGFNFVSTGGGAMLDFLADGSIAGLEVLKK